MLVVNQGFSARYLLRSKIFDILKKSGLKIVILSPAAFDKNFTQEFSGDKIFHELYRPQKYRDINSKIYQFFTQAYFLSFKNIYKNNCTNYWRSKRFYSSSSPLRKLSNTILKLVIFFLNRSEACRKIFIKIESLITSQVHKNIFKKYKPDLLLINSVGVLPYDRFIMQEAKKNDSKVLSLILSWDNTTTKGLAGASVDYAIAWTNKMYRELVDFHDVDPKKIFIGGVAQYDDYFETTRLMTKDSLIRKFNISKDKKIIFYCLESPTSYKHNPKVLEILAEKILSGSISSPCQLIVRPHPIYFRSDNGRSIYEEDLKELEGIKKQYPFVIFDYPEILENNINHDMPSTESLKLGALLKYSDVVLSFYSSMAIEASIFNTPIINVELFDRHNISNKIVANHAHNKRVLSTGGVKSASNINDLVKFINDYLNDPSLDDAGRKRIIEQETGPNKGNAAYEIANHIVSLVNNFR